MMKEKRAKTQYSEAEAAHRLGVSVEHLRMLVRSHIVHYDELPENTTFRASDLIVLRVLASQRQNALVH